MSTEFGKFPEIDRSIGGGDALIRYLWIDGVEFTARVSASGRLYAAWRWTQRAASARAVASRRFTIPVTNRKTRARVETAARAVLAAAASGDVGSGLNEDC